MEGREKSGTAGFPLRSEVRRRRGWPASTEHGESDAGESDAGWYTTEDSSF